MNGLNNFHYAISLAQTLYDIEGDQEDLEEIGLIAYNFIGNRNTILKKELASVNCETGLINLPCKASLVEAVTLCGPEDRIRTSNIHDNGDIASFYIENYIESQKYTTDPLYVSGQFVKYRQVGNKLYIKPGIDTVIILYHEEILDEDGLPFINEKEAIAIAEYIAYTVKYKEAIRTNNQTIMSMAINLKSQWLFHCDAARTPIYVSQNDMDKILDVHSSGNRKIYGRSYKPVI